MSTSSLSDACTTNAVDYDGHSSKFIQVLDESLSLVREDINDWLQHYLFFDKAPAIPAQYLLYRLGSGLWLSRLAYKLQQSVFSRSSLVLASDRQTPSYQFLRGAVSNPALRSVSRASLPEFPPTLTLCATRLDLGHPDLCAYPPPPGGDLPPSSSTSPLSTVPSQESSPVAQTRKISGRWLARDNVSSFIQWCRDLGIPQTVIFETTGLVHRTEEKNVILTLMELARIASRYGLADLPELVRIEREIDALEAARAAAAKNVSSATDATDKGAGSNDQVAETSIGSSRVPEDQGSVGEETSTEVDGFDPASHEVPPSADATTSFSCSPAVQLSPETSRATSLSTSVGTIVGEGDQYALGALDLASDGESTDYHHRVRDAESSPRSDGDHRDTGQGQTAKKRLSPVTFVHNQPSTPPALQTPCTRVDSEQQLDSRPPGPFDDLLKNVTKRRAPRDTSCDGGGGPQRKKFARQEALNFDSPSPQVVGSPRTPCTVLRRLNLSCSPTLNDTAERSAVSSIDQVSRPTPSDNPNAAVISSTRARYLTEADRLVAEQVEKKLAQCTCCNRLHMQRLDEGRYRLGGRVYYLRRFRNHVMARVGGGWLTLDEFLNRYDPCRKGNARINELRSGRREDLATVGRPPEAKTFPAPQPPETGRLKTASSSGDVSTHPPGRGGVPKVYSGTAARGAKSRQPVSNGSAAVRVRLPLGNSRDSFAK